MIPENDNLMGIRLSPSDFDGELLGGRSAEEVNEYLASLDGESDRGLVLTLASVLDDLCKSYLEEIFCFGSTKAREEMFEFNGAFGTFSARVKALYTLGKIGEHASRDLHIIRKLRNDCAHKWARFSLEAEAPRINALFDRIGEAGRDASGRPIELDVRFKFKWVGTLLVLALLRRNAQGD